ncbi:MAG: HD domain-containing protein [Eubacteriales bacterium]|nr:HD domain-containing protein [Eubacteriales bacterium]
MIYTDPTKRAMQIAYKAHHGQTDKSDVPYIFHPIHLAEQMQTEAETITALLHDVVEDTDVTLDDLVKEDFSSEVIAALQLLTHDDAVPYLDYVREIKKNPIARAVKLADLKHNSDSGRLSTLDEKALARLEKYKMAIAILNT